MIPPCPAGYRSIHYVFESTPLKQKIYTEVQVRTIFEEGWSEIDHKVRYPNFSDSEQVSYFLRIFNRLAGSADEMGTFVKELVTELKATASQLNDIANENAKIKEENEQNIGEIDRLFNELEASKGNVLSKDNLVSQLKAEVDKLKSQSQSLSRLHKEVFTSDSKAKTNQSVDLINMINNIRSNIKTVK